MMGLITFLSSINLGHLLGFIIFSESINAGIEQYKNKERGEVIQIKLYPRKITYYKLVTGFHYGFLGMKRTGKTHNVIKACEHTKEGVFFFNVQHEKMPSNFIKANPNSDMNTIANLLKANKKINFLPSLDDEKANKEFKAIVDFLFNVKGLEIFFVADEGSMYDKFGIKALEKLATRGQTFGLNLIIIAQRGTMIPNNVMKQLDSLIFHDSPFEFDYWKQYHIPIDKILDLINKNSYMMKWKDGDYNRTFVEYSRNKISEPMAIK